ncbi:MAG: hypothetical protein WBH47_13795 [Streptosporangiaceae bacterium]
MRWRERWARLPMWARCVLGAYAAGFTDGTGAHVRDLARRGLNAYGFAPAAVQVFFVSLVLLDPLVVVLIVRVCRAGVWLAGSVMAADMAANWFVSRASLSLLLRPAAGLLAITVFGLFVLISVIPLQRCLSAAASADRVAARE